VCCSGSFAVVKRAVRKSDHKEFAIKIIKKSKLKPDELAVVHDEVEIMHKITHENCVQLYEMFETPKHLYMVMELLTGGELFERIIERKSFSERQASNIIKDVLHSINYLHNIGIVHRDLKPENLIFLDHSEASPIKITDFGLAKFRSITSKRRGMTTACGTPGYVAPEVLNNEPYGKEVDLWSVGVIMYILLCGFPPFYHESTGALYKMIKRGQYDFPKQYWGQITDSAKDLIRKFLTVNPRKRINATEALKHPWIAGDTASDQLLDTEFVNRIRLLQAKRVLRRVVRTIIALNRFSMDIVES
jgi:serine/threonine protein kinase